MCFPTLAAFLNLKFMSLVPDNELMAYFSSRTKKLLFDSDLFSLFSIPLPFVLFFFSYVLSVFYFVCLFA